MTTAAVRITDGSPLSLSIWSEECRQLTFRRMKFVRLFRPRCRRCIKLRCRNTVRFFRLSPRLTMTYSRTIRHCERRCTAQANCPASASNGTARSVLALQELRVIGRMFRVMGMYPVGYYDLSMAVVPVHSTAFRAINEVSLNSNPFRVFTSLLRLDLIGDTSLRQRAEQILRSRRIVRSFFARSWKPAVLSSARKTRGKPTSFFRTASNAPLVPAKAQIGLGSSPPSG